MATNEKAKSAYRCLLYRAIVDIRNSCLSSTSLSWNILSWHRGYKNS